ncbi:MAG: dihydrolipoyl dehydrogenase [Spirochaetaceae bacterium]|nr:dihydrolipoyl dehydrogenase [Spirochaetaceae bacterium]
MDINVPVITGGKKGKVGKISVKLGDLVNEGDILAQVETGKGNKPVKALESGTITKILCEEGQDVLSKQGMFELTLKEENSKTKISQESPTTSEKKINNIATDLLVIGSGPGGYVAAIYAAKKGLKVTVVEKEYIGGTCLNVGCIPTKSLVKSSEICHNVKNSSLFGINTTGLIQVDMERVISQKKEVVDKLVSGVDFLMQKNNINVIKGQASFITQNKISLTGEKNYTISAKDIIIATGSVISKINIPGIDLPFVMNSTTALSSTKLPKSITIIGGGVIGMEFAFIYRNLGVEVNVVEFMDRLLTMVDKDVSKEIESIAKDKGIKIYTSSKVNKIQSSNDNQAIITFENEKGEQLLISEKVLSAIGRQPNLEGLDIEKAGVKLNNKGRGITVDENMKTNVPHVYAIGDVTNIIQLAHVASHQGTTAVSNILGETKSMDYFAVPNVIFTAPEISSVGLNEDECKIKKLDYKASKFNYMSNGKALTMNETRGFIKLIKDNKTNKIIGGTVIGTEASSLIGTITLAISNGLTDEEIRETIFAHPTTSEIIHEAAYGLGIGALHE